MLQTAHSSYPHALVDIVDADEGAQRTLAHWLTAAGIQSRTYAHLGEALKAHSAELPGCLVIDAQPPAISGLELQAILLPLAVGCPIVVMADKIDVTMPFRSVKTGAIDFVQKPLCQPEIVTAIRAAIDVDRHQRLMASRHAELRARFATLSPRERQVMLMVTAGLMNKQIGIDLGVSEITIKAHRGSVMRKMRTRSLAELVRMADAIGDDAAPMQRPVQRPVNRAVPRNDYSRPARIVAAADHRNGYILAPG